MKQLHVLLNGRVQGVGFRYFVLREANARGLTGWVRNRGERQVEMVAEGPQPSLEDFLDAVRQGPPAARVDSSQVEWREASGAFSDFAARASSY